MYFLITPFLLLNLGLSEFPSCFPVFPSSLFFFGFGSFQDQKLFREDGGWKLVGAVAQYWCSRMVWSEEEQCYHIRGTSASARPVRGEGLCKERLRAPPARWECVGSVTSCPVIHIYIHVARCPDFSVPQDQLFFSQPLAAHRTPLNVPFHGSIN